MAFNNSPENSTYKTVDLEFTATSWYRSGYSTENRDPAIVNMFFDRNSNENQTREFALVKRPGLDSTSISTNVISKINGYFQDDSSNYIYWSTNNKVYSHNMTTGVTTVICTMTGTLTNYVNSVGFCSFLTSTGTRYICFNNGSELWYHVVGSGTSTQVTDADYPASTYPTIVFLDGYLFVIKKDTGDIYNSDFDDPSAWTPGNYITAEINPDLAIALAKVKNYLICFGRDGIEFFYDAGQPSGSPLARNESYYKAVTLTSNVCKIGDNLFFSGKLQNQGQRIYTLDGNELSPISVSWVDRYLQNNAYSSVLTTGVSEQNGFGISLNGNHFYMFSIAPLDLLFVYDIQNKFWYRWTLASGSNRNQVSAVWSANSYVQDYPLIALGTRSTLCSMPNNVFQDLGSNFTCSYITQDFDAQTFNWKSCHRVGLHCDYPATSGVTSYAQISWSDDDWNTSSTPRNINVNSLNPYITQLGRFRNRSYKLEYSDNYPIRIRGITMDLNVGNH